MVIQGIARSDICAAIVTYFPQPESAANLTALAAQVGRLLVIDNGSSPETLQPVESAARDVGATVVHLGSNFGIAKALNTGLQLAGERGYRWLATFDQDSHPDPQMLQEMGAAFAAYPGSDRVGLIAPVHVDRRAGIVVSDRRREESGPTWHVIRTTMTSGNLVNIDAAMKVGGFDDSLFIDYVDNEFCLRLRRRGYRVLEAPRAQLSHALGNMELRNLGILRAGITHHAALRRYYITRNRLLVWQQYWRCEPAWVLRDMRRFLSESAGIVFFEKDTAAKVRMTLRGIRDALQGVRGEFDAAR
ncbi:MAG TPA: glycosyltransferase family 2 protein [Steroidobacteraceae bacterium]